MTYGGKWLSNDQKKWAGQYAHIEYACPLACFRVLTSTYEEGPIMRELRPNSYQGVEFLFELR